MLIPMLDLKTADGSPVPWERWWQHRPVAMLFAHESCETCREAAQELRHHSDENPDPESIRIVVTASDKADAIPRRDKEPDRDQSTSSAGADETHDLVHVVDPDHRLADALGARPGVVVAADRFFEVRGAADVHANEPGKAVDAVYDRIGLSEGECPECGAPVW